MNFSIFFLLLGLCMAYGETVEKPNVSQTEPSQLSPTYTNPGLSPTYTGNNQLNPTYNGNNHPAQPTDVYPNYGYGEYAYGYPPYPVQKSETQESGLVRTLGTILPVLRVSRNLFIL